VIVVWPKFYPEGCPPQDSVSANGVFYRLVNDGVVSRHDFWSQRELKPSAIFQNMPECQACGTSIFADLADAERVKKLPTMRKKKIAQGQVDPSMGQMKPTPSAHRSHHTWWVPANCDPSPNFVVLP
jgi:hypothetical protein